MLAYVDLTYVDLIYVNICYNRHKYSLDRFVLQHLEPSRRMHERCSKAGQGAENI